MNVYPAILTDSLDIFEEQLAVVKNQPKVKNLHVDIIDGFFVDNLTITPMDLADLELGGVEVDFHLMTEEPIGFAEEIINYQAYFKVGSVIGQVEKMTSQSDFVDLLKERNLKAGLSLNLYTPVEEIEPSVLKKLDVVQLMAIEAGEQGKKFDTKVLAKVEELVNKAREVNPQLKIIVDGGVKAEQIQLLKKYEIDGVVIGSAIWHSDDPAQSLERFLHD